MKKLLLVTLAVMVAGAAMAQRVQLGVRAGITSRDLELKDARLTTDSRLGWHVAAVSRLRLIGAGSGLLGFGLFLQPEIVYSQNSYRIQGVVGGVLDSPPIRIKPSTRVISGGETSKIRMQTIDVPVLLSAKISLARVQAGPVFNLMNRYETTKGKIEIMPSRPIVGYVLGASVDILGFTLDGRYHGEFKRLKNNIKEGDSAYESIRGSLSSWSVGLSMLF